MIPFPSFGTLNIYQSTNQVFQTETSLVYTGWAKLSDTT